VRPLVHPSADDITLEGVMHALSDPTRLHIFAQIAQASCPQTCSAFVEVRDRVVPKSTLSQHFKVLREAGLVRSERRGVEMENTTRCAEVEARFPGLLRSILDAHRAQQARKAGTGRKKPGLRRAG
jgi:DNA-binding transcriptional ArsR family regulator